VSTDCGNPEEGALNSGEQYLLLSYHVQSSVSNVRDS
jgi:hypothetical protein